MKRTAIIGLLITIALNAAGQQDPKLSQNMFLIPSFNPGAMGQSDKICATLAARSQWIGYPGAPTTSIFSAHAPFSLFGRDHGAGIDIMNDNYGLNNDFHIRLGYSYKIKLGDGVLGLGVNGGMINHAFQGDKLEGYDVIDLSDPNIPNYNANDFAYDFGAGAFYTANNLYFGVSGMHLLTGRLDLQNPSDETNTALVRMQRHMYATGGYTIQLPNPIFEITPSFLLQTDFGDYHIYLNANVRYNKRFWGGVSYSVGGAATALFGVELLNGVQIGASYDVDLSPLVKYSAGSFELTVRYCFDLSLDKTPQKYESIRFL